MKSQLVLKAQNVINHQHLQFDAGWNDIAQSFMAIRKTLTASGKHVTYDAGRNQETGHADLAWACMHALANESLDGELPTSRSTMEIY